MKNINSFKKMKQKKEKITVITAYNYSSGKFVQEAGTDIILVGDSLGMVILGYKDTLKVTISDIIYHTKAVRRGADDTFIVADMPFMSYHISLAETKRNAAKLIYETGANAVKLEGGKPTRLEAIKAIVDCEIPVVAHLGLTPQSINAIGGYIVQGKKEIDYQIDMANKMNPQGITAALLGMKERPMRLDIVALSPVPVLFILGKQDSRIPLEKALAQAATADVAQINVFGNAGHMAWQEETEKTGAALDGFMKLCCEV